jgi:hypothetical protein
LARLHFDFFAASSNSETAVFFETREPEPIPIRRTPGLRNAIEPLNRIIRIRADAAGGFDDSACAPDHSDYFIVLTDDPHARAE